MLFSYRRAVLWIVFELEVLCVAHSFMYSPAISNIKSGFFNRRHGRSVNNEQHKRAKLTLSVAKSYSALAKFIAAEAENANDDLLFSLRISQGQLSQLRAEAPQLYTGSEVSQLLEAAERDLNAADQVLMAKFKSQKQLSEDFSFMMDHELWQDLERLEASSSHVDFHSAWAKASMLNQGSSGEKVLKFSEENSDACLSELKPRENTAAVKAATGRSTSCSVSSPCWRLMTRPNAGGYVLTHQLLFLAMGRSVGCGPDFERLAERDLEGTLPRGTSDVTSELVRGQCRSVLQEALTISAAGYPDEKKDLFLEQGLLCGAMVRMPEFFQPAMIRSVVSWQKQSGCFGFVDVDAYLNSLRPEEKAAILASGGHVPSARHGAMESMRNFWMKLPNGKIDTLNGHSKLNNRQLVIKREKNHFGKANRAATGRREKIMNRSCLSHNSAVAMGYLSVALRYLAEQ